ncbi:MAG: hypothetical protein IT431_07485 [Phycisphaerales bacterium]|nr:hypothetical protein [Phycisphaerales bacterium]
MDPARRQRIKDSFNALEPHGEALMNRLFERLFSDHPEVRPLFPDDLGRLKLDLRASLASIVKSIDNFAALEQPLKKMGARHLAYGARPEHYPLLGATLLAAMDELAGGLWTDQLREDWAAAVGAISQIMLDGAAEAERFRAAG